MVARLPSVFLALAIAAVLTGCGSERIVVYHTPATSIEPSGSFKAGAWRERITPHRPMPAFGFGAASHHAMYDKTGSKAEDVSTELYVRAVVMEDAQGRRWAIVASDLGCASSLVHWKLAQRVATATGLSVDRIMLTASHTHSAPSGFASTAFYNWMGSSKLYYGYDETFTNFLVDRIAYAIEQAVGRLEAAELSTARVEVPGLTRNRSLEAYRKNENAEGGHCPATAVDSRLTALRLDPAGRHDRAPSGSRLAPPIACVLVYGGHPTVMGTDNNRWHSDVFGYAAERLELQLAQGDEVPVVALLNGANGDVSFQWIEQSHNQVVELGQRLADAAMACVQNDVASVQSPRLSHAYEEADLQGANIGDSGDTLSHVPRMGVPTTAGAEDGRSMLYSWLADEGQRACIRVGRHGAKKIFLWPFQGLIVPNQYWPRYAPLQVFVIGDVTLLATPFEQTTEAARRLEAAVGGERTAVVSVANDYHGYCATREEYEAQHYEGSSTMYGPHVAAFVRSRFVAMTRGEPIQPLPEYRVFLPGRRAKNAPDTGGSHETH